MQEIDDIKEAIAFFQPTLEGIDSSFIDDKTNHLIVLIETAKSYVGVMG